MIDSGLEIRVPRETWDVFLHCFFAAFAARSLLREALAYRLAGRLLLENPGRAAGLDNNVF